MTKEDYERQMKSVCDYIRKLNDKIETLQKEVAELKQSKPQPQQKPIVELTDEQKKAITDYIQTDQYDNDEAMGKVEWRRNMCYVSYLPSQNTPSEKQLDFGKKMVSTYSNFNELNRFLFGKVLDMCKRYKLNRVQMQFIKEDVKPKPKQEPHPTNKIAKISQ